MKPLRSLRVLAAVLMVASMPSAVAQVGADTRVLQQCAWSEDIGRERYIGTLEDALLRYSTVFTPGQIEYLREQVTAGQRTDQLTLTRDAIQADTGLAVKPGIAMMHFGVKSVCMAVRRVWGPGFSTRADLYAVPGSTLAMASPHLCRNWSVVELAQPFEVPVTGQAPKGLIRALREGVTPPDQRRTGGEASGPGIPTGPAPPFTDGVRRALAGEPVPWPYGGPRLDVMPGPQQALPDATQAPANSVPEPQSLALVLLALLGGGWATRRAKRRGGAA
jgi:hypothetical protein